MINITLTSAMRTCLLVLVFLSSTFVHGQSSIEVIRARCVEDALALPSENKSVSQILALMNGDGSFTDRSPDIFVIEDRILKLAQEYVTNPAYQNDVNLKNNIYKVWNYWNLNYDLPQDLANWTVEVFRLPRAEGLLGNLMREELMEDYESNPLARAITDYVSSLDEAIWENKWNRPDIELGANFSSRFRGAIYVAAFSGDERALRDVQSKIDEILELGSGLDTQIPGYPHTGLTPDYSWHQHNRDGGQMIWGNYGTVFLDEFGKFMRLVSGTDYDLSHEHYQVLFDAIAFGLRYFIYKEEISQLVLGRKCFNNHWGGTFGVVVERIADGMAPGSITNAQMDLMRTMILQWRDSNRPATLNDSRVFYTSDMMVHARPNNHTVVRMLSNRTGSLELGIGLETQNYHMGDGATLFRIEGHEYEQSWPTSIMTSVPGTTAEQKSGMPTQASTGTTNSNNSFAGGTSDGSSMVGAFDLNKAQSYSSIRANKAYYFHDDIMGFLGTGIRQDGSVNKDIWTTINQVERKTDVTYNVGSGNVVVPLNSNVQRDFNNVSSPVWFFQDGFGYIIVPETSVDIKFWAQMRSGAWSDVNSRESSKKLDINMFHLVINHGNNPQNDKYQYFVVPNTTPSQLASMVANNPLEIISNNAAQSVMYHNGNNKGQFVFYTNNQRATLSSGLEMFSAKPAIIQTEEKSDSLIVWVTDPNHSEASIQLRTNVNLSGNGATWNATTEETTIQVNLPQGIYKGQSVRMAFALASDIPNALPNADFQYTAETMNAPSNVNFDAGLSNDPDGNITSFEWKFEDGTTYTGPTAARMYTDPGTYDVTLKVTDDRGGIDSTRKSIVITEEVAQVGCNLPAAWKNTDVGNVPVSGTACSNNNEYTLTASGGDIWDYSDEFHYMYRSLNGDGEISVRVVSIEQHVLYSKVGLMMRDNLSPTSHHAHIFFHSSMKYHSMQYREFDGGNTTNAGTYSGTVSFPYYIKLTRSGNTFRGYMSPDGNTWDLVGEQTISMGTQIYAGVTTTNKDFSGTTSSVVDNLAFSQTSNPGTFPVEFLNFNAVAQPHLQQVHLNWETASEINNSHFIVQKSLDGGLYEDIVKVNGQGNSNSVQSYQAFDVQPYTGKSFYRVKQVDFSGLYSYSKVVELVYDGDLIRSFTAYPNPIKAGNQLNLEAQLSGVPSVTLEIRNYMGQLVHLQKDVRVSPDGNLLMKFNTANLMAGKYLITLSNPEYLEVPFSQKLIVLP